jgi:NTE family protein
MTTAFVLSGGASLGAVQVGMLLALSDRHITPDLLVGASVGAVNAAFLAGHPGPVGVEALADIWSRVRRAHVFPSDPVRVVRAMAGRATALANPQPLRRLVTQCLPYERLEDAPWPVAVVATEVATGLEVVLSAGNAVDAVLASAALPGVLPPVVVDGHLLMDGGVVNNTPISVAHSLGADRIYVLPTGYACALPRPPRSPLTMALHAAAIAIQRRLIDDVHAMHDIVELHVAPPLCPLAVAPTDFRHSAMLVERARIATRAWLDRPAHDDPAGQLQLHQHHSTALGQQASSYDRHGLRRSLVAPRSSPSTRCDKAV